MNKIYKISLCISALLLANFSSQNDDAGQSNLNIYGTVTTVENNSYNIERITISGMTKNIAVYAKPGDENANPATDTTRLNLEDVKIIKRAANQMGILKYKNREYVEFTVVWNDKQKKDDTGIIERSKQLIGYLANAPRQKKEISFEALQLLEIKGVKFEAERSSK